MYVSIWDYRYNLDMISKYYYEQEIWLVLYFHTEIVKVFESDDRTFEAVKAYLFKNTLNL